MAFIEHPCKWDGKAEFGPSSPVGIVSSATRPNLDHTRAHFLTFHNIVIPAYEWCRSSKKVCCRQHELSLCSPKLFCWPLTISHAIPHHFWSRIGGMWNGCRCKSGMDKTLKVLLASVSGKGRYCLWCWQGILLRPRCAVTCCWIIYQNYFLAFFLLPQT